MYSIKNGYIYDNGMETGVKAKYSKKEIFQLYGWNRELGRRMLWEIAHKIYKRNPDGTYKVSKKTFTPNELCYILDYFGLP